MNLFRHNSIRWFGAVVAIFLLGGVYVFQLIDFSSYMGDSISPNNRFIINKTIRFLLNDGACILLIAAIFNQTKYISISTWVFLLELLVLLPCYFILKLSLEGDSEISSPLLSQLHRMIVNPLLMIVLTMGFVYQKYFFKPGTTKQ